MNISGIFVERSSQIIRLTVLDQTLRHLCLIHEGLVVFVVLLISFPLPFSASEMLDSTYLVYLDKTWVAVSNYTPVQL